MANMCSNYVSFTGKKANMENLLLVLKEMFKRSEETGNGVIPVFQEKSWDGYYFDLQIINDDVDAELSISYETRWYPIIKDLNWLAIKMGVSFVSQSSESGNNICISYEYVHESGELSFSELTNDEIDQCKFWKTEDDEVVKSSYDSTKEEEGKFSELNYYLDEDYEMLENNLSKKSKEVMDPFDFNQ